MEPLLRLREAVGDDVLDDVGRLLERDRERVPIPGGEVGQDEVGSVLPVMIDAVDADNLAATGRTPYDAPEIDGVVHISDIDGIKPGDIVHVEIEDSDAHDLYGRVY